MLKSIYTASLCLTFYFKHNKNDKSYCYIQENVIKICFGFIKIKNKKKKRRSSAPI